jgi:hypothetical protein
MFPMSPEDKYREVMQYQEDQRRQMARERMARAVPAKRQPGPSGTRLVKPFGIHDLWLAARNVLHSLTTKHGVVRHRAR